MSTNNRLMSLIYITFSCLSVALAILWAFTATAHPGTRRFRVLWEMATIISRQLDKTVYSAEFDSLLILAGLGTVIFTALLLPLRKTFAIAYITGAFSFFAIPVAWCYFAVRGMQLNGEPSAVW